MWQKNALAKEAAISKLETQLANVVRISNDVSAACIISAGGERIAAGPPDCREECEALREQNETLQKELASARDVKLQKLRKAPQVQRVHNVCCRGSTMRC